MQRESTPTNQRPLKLFYSYSHADEALRDELDCHLKLLTREGLISEWHDRKLRAGDNWNQVISDELESADVILLLVSKNFLASSYCRGPEVTRALERYHAGKAIVIPILLTPCTWTSEEFAKLQVLPMNARPLSEWPEAGFARVAEELRTVLVDLNTHRSLSPTKSVVQPAFEAYEGQDPYLFVSYSHKDSGIVYPEMARLHHLGYRIWYDEGIDPGNECSQEVANALALCSFFFVFISPRAVESQNVKNEINFAINRKKGFKAIHLEETELPTGLELRMGDIQAVLKWRMEADRYQRKMEKALPRNIRENR